MTNTEVNAYATETNNVNAESMYSEIILDYYRNPRNYGTIEGADASSRDVNPSCGDVIEIQMRIADGKITEAKFNGKGCAISQAAVSMLCENIEGKSLEEVIAMSREEMLGLLGVEVSGMRSKCALLGFKVAKMALIEKFGAQEVKLQSEQTSK